MTSNESSERLVERSTFPGISFLVNVQPVCGSRPLAPSCPQEIGDSALPDPLSLARAFGDLVGAFLKHR